LAGAAAIVLIAAGCGTEGLSTAAVVAPKPFALDAAQLALVVEKAAVRGSRESARWVASMHADAMQEVLSNGAALRVTGPAARCAAVAKIVRNQFPAMRRQSVLSDASLETILAAALQRGGCAVSSPASVFGAPLLLGSAVAQTEPSTGAYLPYAESIQNYFLNAGHPGDIEAHVAATLASASAIPAADYEILSGIGSMAVADAYYWYAVEQGGGCGACGGGGGGGGGGSDPYAMSVFGSLGVAPLAMMQSRCGFWCRTGWSDLVGGLGAVAGTAKITGGMIVIAPQAAAVAFGAGSVTASALYAISAM